MSVAEKLIKIAENEPKVFKAGKFAVLSDSRYMHPTVSGSAIRVDDVNAIEHKLGVGVKSKNLFNINAQPYNTNIIGSGTYEVIGNTLKVYRNREHRKGCVYAIELPVGTEFTISYDTVLGGNATGIFNLISGVKQYADTEIVIGRKYTVDESGLVLIEFSRTGGADDTNGWAEFSNIQLELGTEATPYTPYISDFSGIEVSRYGKNLFDKSIPYTDWVSVGGGYREIKIYVGYNPVAVSVMKKYTPPEKEGILQVKFGEGQAVSSIYNTNNEGACKQSVTSTSTDGYVIIRATSPAYDGFKDEIMIELGTTSTEYEPYITPQTAYATTDGTVNGLTSISPTMTLISDNDDATINCTYYRDIDTYIDNLNTAVALSGGE